MYFELVIASLADEPIASRAFKGSIPYELEADVALDFLHEFVIDIAFLRDQLVEYLFSLHLGKLSLSLGYLRVDYLSIVLLGKHLLQ